MINFFFFVLESCHSPGGGFVAWWLVGPEPLKMCPPAQVTFKKKKVVLSSFQRHPVHGYLVFPLSPSFGTKKKSIH